VLRYTRRIHWFCQVHVVTYPMMVLIMTENNNVSIDDSASSSFALPETMALLLNLNNIERTLAAKSYSSGGGNRNDENNDDLYSEFDNEEEHVNNSEPLF
jgi:hypothetical protein